MRPRRRTRGWRPGARWGGGRRRRGAPERAGRARRSEWVGPSLPSGGGRLVPAAGAKDRGNKPIPGSTALARTFRSPVWPTMSGFAKLSRTIWYLPLGGFGRGWKVGEDKGGTGGREAPAVAGRGRGAVGLAGKGKGPRKARPAGVSTPGRRAAGAPLAPPPAQRLPARLHDLHGLHVGLLVEGALGWWWVWVGGERTPSNRRLGHAAAAAGVVAGAPTRPGADRARERVSGDQRPGARRPKRSRGLPAGDGPTALKPHVVRGDLQVGLLGAVKVAAAVAVPEKRDVAKLLGLREEEARPGQGQR
jgi:hypothetical protein